MRRVRFKDPESARTLIFLTNNTTLPALTITALYKSRWQVELFFIAIVKKELLLDASRFDPPDADNQLNLFNF